MTPELRDEIKQSRPFDSLEQEALLSIERTAAVLMHRFADSLKAHGITPTQYNVLRILRGAGSDGLPTLEIGQSAPADQEYILHIPAGKPIPFKLEVSGSAITQPGTASTFVESRQEVYVYKHWASLDGKTWLPNRQLFKSVFSVGLDTRGGIAKIRFDQVAP